MEDKASWIRNVRLQHIPEWGSQFHQFFNSLVNVYFTIIMHSKKTLLLGRTSPVVDQARIATRSL